MKWAIFDLDGTLCDIGHRLHYIRPADEMAAHGFKPNWDEFHKACSNDEPKHEITELLKTLSYNGVKIAIFSGRDATYEQLTREWLDRHGIAFTMLVLRNPKDYRSDFIIKKEAFEARFKPEDIWFVVDDRDQVVKMWREIGLTCLQCQKGEY